MPSNGGSIFSPMDKILVGSRTVYLRENGAGFVSRVLLSSSHVCNLNECCLIWTQQLCCANHKCKEKKHV